MVALDNRTLLLVTALISIGAAIALIALWKAQTQRNGASYWAIGMSMVAIAGLFVSGRGVIPDFISVVIANTFYVSGFLLIARGVRIFARRSVLNYLDIGLPLLCMISFYYFYYIESNLSLRIAILSAAFVVASCVIIWTLLRDKSAIWRSAGFAVAAVFMVFGTAHGTRGVVAIFSTFEYSFMHPTVTSSLVFLTGIFTLGGMAITLILLTYAALESELRIVSLAVKQSASSVVITDAKGKIEYVNPAFIEKSGYSSKEVIGQNPRMLRSQESDPKHYEALWSCLTAGKTWRGEFLNRKKNGELFWEIASISPVKQRNGMISHYVALKEDITALKKAEKRILHMANHDPLTGLPTRRLANDRLLNALVIAKRHKIKAAIMFVDLDGFKLVNDTLGHDAGDYVLKETAQRLRATIREVDTVARVGGDEFWILLSDLQSKEGATKIAEKIITALSSRYHFEGNEIHISASVGIALYPDHGIEPEVLIKLADKAMYQIKGQGKNNYAFSSGQNEVVS